VAAERFVASRLTRSWPERWLEFYADGTAVPPMAEASTIKPSFTPAVS
jgi:hypothetical protein